MEQVTTERKYNIHYYEVDYRKKCLITTLINYFQDIAIFQSEQLGVGLNYLSDKNHSWVLYQWDINIDRYPMLGEAVKVTTKALSLKGINAYRNFSVLDCENRTIVNADSRWVLLDVKNMKIINIPKEFKQTYGVEDAYATPLKLKKPVEPREFHYSKDFQIRYSDIDTNRHVNNAKYVDLALETMPLEVVQSNMLRHLKILYKNQGRYGDTVKSLTELRDTEQGRVGRHKIVSKEQKPLCLLETYWV